MNTIAQRIAGTSLVPDIRPRAEYFFSHMHLSQILRKDTAFSAKNQEKSTFFVILSLQNRFYIEKISEIAFFFVILHRKTEEGLYLPLV